MRPLLAVLALLPSVSMSGCDKPSAIPFQEAGEQRYRDNDGTTYTVEGLFYELYRTKDELQELRDKQAGGEVLQYKAPGEVK